MTRKTELEQRIVALLAEWHPLALYAEQHRPYPNGSARKRLDALEQELGAAWDEHEQLCGCAGVLTDLAQIREPLTQP